MQLIILTICTKIMKIFVLFLPGSCRVVSETFFSERVSYPRRRCVILGGGWSTVREISRSIASLSD